MKLFSIIAFLTISVFAFFASADTLPSWVHNLNSLGLDKPVHAFIFAIAFWLWSSISPTKHPLSIAVILAHSGLTIELLQFYCANGRSFSWSDEIANCVGIAIAFSIYFITNFKSNFMKKIFTILFLAAFAANMTAQVLPVEVTSFTALAVKGSVVLKWETASEVNGDYFIVDRSQLADNQSFTDIVKLKCNNKASIYQFVDDTPLSAGAYYQLKQVDFGGKVTICKIVFVEGAGINSLLVYPNPSKGDVSIIASGDVTVFDSVGKIIKVLKGSSIITDLPKGFYFLRSGDKYAKIIIQ